MLRNVLKEQKFREHLLSAEHWLRTYRKLNSQRAQSNMVTVGFSHRISTCFYNITVYRGRSLQILMTLNLRVSREEGDTIKYWIWLWIWEDALKCSIGHGLRPIFTGSTKYNFKGRDPVLVCRGHSSKVNIYSANWSIGLSEYTC